MHTHTTFRLRSSSVLSQPSCSRSYHSVSWVEINLLTTPELLGPFHGQWLFDIASYMSLTHSDFSSTGKLSVFLHPKPALPLPSFLMNSIAIYLVAQTGHLRVILGYLLDPCLSLSNLSQCPVSFISSVHLKSTHFSLPSLIPKTQGFPLFYLDASHPGLCFKVTLCVGYAS